MVAKVKVALSCDHHSQSLSVHKASAGVREGPARFKGPMDPPYQGARRPKDGRLEYQYAIGKNERLALGSRRR